MQMEANVNVAHVIVNAMGGITSLVHDLILYKGVSALPQELWMLDIKDNINTPSINDDLAEEIVNHFYIDPLDNWYYTYGKLAASLSKGEGILVSNDQYDLIMLQAFNLPRKVVQLVHDPYNVTLSRKFHECIDAFVTHSHHIYERLLETLPHRREDIFHLAYGIPQTVPIKKIANEFGPLKLFFLGRHDKAKGVYDLFEINQLLKEQNVIADWTILGKGPETDGLKLQWAAETNVRFETPSSVKEVLKIAAVNDIMVFPTKFEGFPVALLEAMSMGCVPVVTDLPGGIQEVVTDGVTGFKCNIDDNRRFAEAIMNLHNNRGLMCQMQLNAAQLVRNNFEVNKQSGLYQELFNKIATRSTAPLHHKINKKIGSRLDQPWLPNVFTKLLRRIK